MNVDNAIRMCINSVCDDILLCIEWKVCDGALQCIEWEVCDGALQGIE